MERVAVPVVNGRQPDPFVGQPAMFAISEGVIDPIEKRLIEDTIRFKEQYNREREAIRNQAMQEMAQRAALQEVMSSPQGQAMLSSQYGVG